MAARPAFYLVNGWREAAEVNGRLLSAYNTVSLAFSLIIVVLELKNNVSVRPVEGISCGKSFLPLKFRSLNLLLYWNWLQIKSEKPIQP